MAERKWEAKDLDAREVYRYIKEHGAATTKELKDHFHTDSTSVRIACGRLMVHNKVFPFGATRGTVWYIRVTGTPGAPNIARIRADAGYPIGKSKDPKEISGLKVNAGELAKVRKTSKKRAKRMTADLPEDDY